MATATLATPEASSNLTTKPTRAVRRGATDDEILGLSVSAVSPAEEPQLEFTWNSDHAGPDGKSTQNGDSQPQSGAGLQAVLDANPELQSAWDDAAAYRKTFATPNEARSASTRLADVQRLDALFFSRRPEDHAELARTVAALDPASFNSLANAMAQLLASAPQVSKGSELRTGDPGDTSNLAPSAVKLLPQSQPSPKRNDEHTASASQARAEQPAPSSANEGLSAAQTQFLHSANAAAVEEVLHAIENQVERLLPEEISKSARNRVVGEIYRELDATLRSNRQLSQQMRDAFRSGPLDTEHQKSIVSILAGRARQALPAVAKRVLNEWTSTIVAANQGRRARQRVAEGRVDIAGSGRVANDARRPTSPRDIDYARMSDSDILNL